MSPSRHVFPYPYPYPCPTSPRRVGGNFSALGGYSRERIGRLQPNGAVDYDFTPGADNWVYALTLQADGKVLVAGSFGTLGGQTRSRVGQLANDAAALQRVTAAPTGSAVSWRRGGTGPDVSHVTFELSTDGVTFTPLGVGTFTNGGWYLGGLSLPFPQEIIIRTRGQYASGQTTGSLSAVSAVRHLYLEMPLFADGFETGDLNRWSSSTP